MLTILCDLLPPWAETFSVLVFLGQGGHLDVLLVDEATSIKEKHPLLRRRCTRSARAESVSARNQRVVLRVPGIDAVEPCVDGPELAFRAFDMVSKAPPT